MQIIIRLVEGADAEAITRLLNQLGYSISVEATLVNIIPCFFYPLTIALLQ